MICEKCRRLLSITTESKIDNGRKPRSAFLRLIHLKLCLIMAFRSMVFSPLCISLSARTLLSPSLQSHKFKKKTKKSTNISYSLQQQNEPNVNLSLLAQFQITWRRKAPQGARFWSINSSEKIWWKKLAGAHGTDHSQWIKSTPKINIYFHFFSCWRWKPPQTNERAQILYCGCFLLLFVRFCSRCHWALAR